MLTQPGSAHTGSFLEQQPLSIGFLRLQEHNCFAGCVTGVPAQTQGAGQHYQAPGSRQHGSVVQHCSSVCHQAWCHQSVWVSHCTLGQKDLIEAPL